MKRKEKTEEQNKPGMMPEATEENGSGAGSPEEEELRTRITWICNFWADGVIPLICPSCGDFPKVGCAAGALQEFRCRACGAKWQLARTETAE